MNLEELLETHPASAAQVAEGVHTLSLMFNGITPRHPGYLANPHLRRAYIRYYLPVNAEKVARTLREMDAYAPRPEKPRVLDFGCGPGTAAIAYLLERGPADLTLVDTVDEALDAARGFCQALGTTPRTLHAPPKDETFDLILAANVYSETSYPLENLLAPGGYLVVVEPALKESTRRLMEWRDRKVEEGWKIAAPCLGERTCPMLAHEDLWCHMDAYWPRPAFISEIDRRCGLSKESLKYSYMVLTREGKGLADLPGAEVRVVSNLHKEKGKAWAWVCGKEGPLCRAEILTRHRSDATAAFFRADRGHVLRMEAAGESCRSQGPVERIL